MKKRFSNFIKNMTLRQKRGFECFEICIVLFCVLQAMSWIINTDLYDQQAAKRWSPDGGYAQISCFYPVSRQEDDYYFQNLKHSIEEALKQESIMAEQESARIVIDTVSAGGEITLSSNQATIVVNAMGVTNDFFQFHPLSLYGGAYFNDSMLMTDGVIIDEDAAWKLFGSNDVVGMEISIGGVPYYIRGVANRKEGHFEEAGGLSESLCYVSLDTLKTYGEVKGSYTYEVILPNPVEGFAMKIIMDTIHDDDNSLQIVENSSRYHIMPLLQDIRSFGIRSMNQKGIVYPYWENIARAYEDVNAVILLAQIICLIPAVLLAVIYIIGRWRHKKWTFHDVIRMIADKFSKIKEYVKNRTTVETGEKKRRKRHEKRKKNQESN